jgi:hypothetical protein
MAKKSSSYSSPMTCAYPVPKAPRGGVSDVGPLTPKVSNHGVYSAKKGRLAPDDTPLTTAFRGKKR